MTWSTIVVYSPDEFSVAPVIMKDDECSLVDNLIAEKLILPTFRPDAPVLLRARVALRRTEEDWSIRSKRRSSIRSKRRQDKFLCYQVVYKRTLSIFHNSSVTTPARRSTFTSHLLIIFQIIICSTN